MKWSNLPRASEALNVSDGVHATSTTPHGAAPLLLFTMNAVRIVKLTLLA